MLMRLRRPSTLVLSALLPATLALAACGSSDDNAQLKGFDAVSVSGAAGEAPKLDWKGQMASGKQQEKVIHEGDGAAVAKGDRVIVNFVVGDGWTKKTVIDSYGPDAGGFVTEVGAKAQPQQVTDLLTLPITDEIKAGMKLGTRLAVTVDSKDVIGQYLGDASVSSYMSQHDIGNEDGLVIVADLVSVVPAAPDGKPTNVSPAWAPKVVEKKGAPTALDFSGVAKPDPKGKLEVATLLQGTGAPVEAGDVIAANYLGQLYDAKKPFDESYSRGTPLSAVISEDFGTVVKGWSKALEGVKVGSRVLIKIPPKLGYGDQAQGKDIPANSTLYFVVDVLAAG
ncbi:FKBP-type peptidyl-prolyl cis-trans isomerase [Nocardioides ginsengisoli]